MFLVAHVFMDEHHILAGKMLGQTLKEFTEDNEENTFAPEKLDAFIKDNLNCELKLAAITRLQMIVPDTSPDYFIRGAL